MDQYGGGTPRLSDPTTTLGMRPVLHSCLMSHNPEKAIIQHQIRNILESTPKCDETTMVVHIDGACRNNGTLHARAAYGIYFGPGSTYNAFGLIPPNMPQTSTRAEIEALAHALPIIKHICAHDPRLVDITIVTDSSYLVKALSLWMAGWIENGGKKADGTRVAHFERLRQLYEQVMEMQYGNNGGIKVQFCHVRRELNREADALANAALDL